jgi:hypothetical protein
MCSRLLRELVIGGICVFVLFTLTACEKPTVNVNVHGVNYSGDEFSYLLIDPNDPEKFTAAEEMNVFSGGGTTCCYPLPTKWHPGIQVTVRTRRELSTKDKNGKWEEVVKDYVAEVPRYEDGKPGEMWVLRDADGSISIVSSDYQPDHEKWPGKVRGWPVPSLEYRRKRWAIIRDVQLASVENYTSLLSELEQNPQKALTESWEYDMKYDSRLLAGFKGPADPAYIRHLKEHYLSGLDFAKRELQRIDEERP